MGFFDTKKEETSKDENPEFLALVTRWDNYLAKIEARFYEALEQGEEAVMENFHNNNLDIDTASTAITGIVKQVDNLIENIDDTYDNKVLPSFLEYKEQWQLKAEYRKGVSLASRLHSELKDFDTIVYGKMAEEFFIHTIKKLDKDVKCTQCNASITINKEILHAQYITCDYCNTVNTFIPSDDISMESRRAITAIAAYKTIKEHQAVESIKRKIQSFNKRKERESIIKAFEERERLELDYWTKFYTEYYKMLPEFEKDLESSVQQKMKHYFYDDRMRALKF